MNEEIMIAAGFEEEVKLIKTGFCPFCLNKVLPDSFRDARSKREFVISGLCQKCQDETFGID